MSLPPKIDSENAIPVQYRPQKAKETQRRPQGSFHDAQDAIEEEAEVMICREVIDNDLEYNGCIDDNISFREISYELFRSLPDWCKYQYRYSHNGKIDNTLREELLRRGVKIMRHNDEVRQLINEGLQKMYAAPTHTSQTADLTERPMSSRSNINDKYFYAGVQDQYLVQTSAANAYFAAINQAIVNHRPMQPEMTNEPSTYPDWLHQYAKEYPYSPKSNKTQSPVGNIIPTLSGLMEETAFRHEISNKTPSPARNISPTLSGLMEEIAFRHELENSNVVAATLHSQPGHNTTEMIIPSYTTKGHTDLAPWPTTCASAKDPTSSHITDRVTSNDILAGYVFPTGPMPTPKTTDMNMPSYVDDKQYFIDSGYLASTVPFINPPCAATNGVYFVTPSQVMEFQSYLEPVERDTETSQWITSDDTSQDSGPFYTTLRVPSHHNTTEDALFGMSTQSYSEKSFVAITRSQYESICFSPLSSQEVGCSFA